MSGILSFFFGGPAVAEAGAGSGTSSSTGAVSSASSASSAASASSASSASSAASEGPPLKILVYNQEKSSPTRLYTTPIENEKVSTKYTIPGAVAPKEYIKGLINGIRATACQGNLSELYIAGAIGRNNHLLVMYEEKIETIVIPAGRRGTATTEERMTPVPIGFILAKKNAEKTNFYIDVICSIRNGSGLLDYFIRYATMEEIPSISLSSLPSVLGYYPKYKFKFRTSCGTPVQAILPAAITEIIRTKSRNLPKTSAESYDIKEYLDFMMVLHAKGLTVKSDEGCGNKALTSAEFKALDCGQDGFTMIRCSNDLAGGRRSKRNQKKRQNRRTRRRQ
jgi:hypothetical protein